MQPATRISLALVPPLFALLLASAARSPRSQVEDLTAKAPVTVILLRHAEPTPGSEPDPELSEAGQARARALARLLGKSGVTHLFASTYKRTENTLLPLSEATGLAITRIDPRESERQLSALEGLPAGSVAVVAGHSNTVPALAQALGGSIDELTQDPRHGALLGHDEFDRIFVITMTDLAGCATKTLELRYGDENP